MVIDIDQEQVKTSVKSTILERLWLLALSMKDKTSVEHCGTVLNKSAAGEEYKWGFRFYVLLMECLRGWAHYFGDKDLKTKFKRLQDSVPIIEEDFYYYQNVELNHIDHKKVDELMNDMSEIPKSPSDLKQSAPVNILKDKNKNMVQSNHLNQEPSEIQELKKHKTDFLEAVFNKNPRADAITEETIKYQSYYEFIQKKVFSSKLELNVTDEYRFVDQIGRLEEKKKIESPFGLAAYRSKVVDALLNCFGKAPEEYLRITGYSVKPKSDNKSIIIKDEANERANVSKTLKKEPPILSKTQPDDYKERLTEKSPIDNRQNQVEAKKITKINQNSQEQQLKNVYDAEEEHNNQQFKKDKTNKNAQQIRAAILGNTNEKQTANKYENYENIPLAYDSNNQKNENTKLRNLNSTPIEEQPNDDINQQLKNKKKALEKEIEELQKREKKLQKSIIGKTEVNEFHQMETKSRIWIQEISQRNHVIDTLQSKYSLLLSDLHSKVQYNMNQSLLSHVSSQNLNISRQSIANEEKVSFNELWLNRYSTGKNQNEWIKAKKFN